MRCKHHRSYQGCFTRLASRYRSPFTLVWTFLALLSVPGFNQAVAPELILAAPPAAIVEDGGSAMVTVEITNGAGPGDRSLLCGHGDEAHGLDGGVGESHARRGAELGCNNTTVQDRVDDDAETILITASHGGGMIGASRTITIIDDDADYQAEALSREPVTNDTPDTTAPTISIVLSPGHGVPLNTAITATVTLDNLDPASYSSLVFRADLTEWEQAFARSIHCEGKDTSKDITVEVDASRETITVEVWKSCSQDIYAYFTLDAALFRLDTSAPGVRVELASAETRFAMSRYLQAGQTAPPPPAPGVAAWLDPDPTSFEWKVGESVVFRARTDILQYLNHHLGVRGFGSEDGARFADDTNGLDAEEACRNVDDGIVDWRRAIHQPVRFFACRAGEATIEVWHETEAERLSTYEFRIRPADGAPGTPGVRVSNTTLAVDEGGSGTYAVALQTRPTADVTVTITGASGDLSLDRTSLVFTEADWRDPRDVEVTAADDDDSARDPDVTLTHRASGAAEYRGLTAEVVVTIRENDPGLVFGESSLTVPEGETATYTVALATEPTAEVTVRIAGASGDLSLDKTRLAFTRGDWDDPQTITVEAAEDDDASTDAAVTLTHRASGGGYDGVAGTVRVAIREDDSGGGDPPPPPPPPSNRPPVATEEMTAQILELGDTLELDASDHFRDPDRRRMTFEAESADSAVATVEVEDSAVTVRGVGHGAAAVTVTAVDHRRARAAQSFEVTVGRLVSFASEEVSAVEGGAATLTVVISRPRDAATALDYVVGPDDDPATADADADDHDGMAGTVVIAAGAAEAAIAIAVRDDDDIEPPRETFAVTLKRSAEQARDFGLGVAAVRVRIDEGVCDRTRQVRDALRGSRSCARVAESDLAGVRTLDLSNSALTALRSADFSGLPNLRALDLSGNSLASLPDGVFAGLGELSEVQLQDNPGSPFVLRVELARTDGPASAPSPARLATRVRQGAPFPMRAGLRAVGGVLSRDASLIATGMTESAPMLVAREAAAAATRVELASAPSVPDTRCGFGERPCYRGFATAIGDPLILFKDPPEVRESVPATDLAAENDSVRINLSELFAAADGGPLRYSARSSDPGLAEAEVRGGVLIVVSGEDGREGTATITVTATDADGLSAELTFEVTLESMPRGFMRGWRRALIEGIVE